MNYHFIAIGGAVMHNIALELAVLGHSITGSDDEIYEPSRSRLAKRGILPEKDGWDPQRIHGDLDAIILGMHAKAHNPELQKAMNLGIPVYSFPDFIFHHAKEKNRIVVAGSHGKTTTTSMIMHALRATGMDFDYLVGAQLPGFERMVRLSDAPLMIIEGDEYLSSSLDTKPKFLHYKPQIAVITGIAWDHMNVFPTFANYVEQFEDFINTLQEDCILFYYQADPVLTQLISKYPSLKTIQYDTFPYRYENNSHPVAIGEDRSEYPLSIFGEHNMQNLKAAQLVCRELGVSEASFLGAMHTFSGARKRLQILHEDENLLVYRDFAHAPSKVQATVKAVRERYPGHHLIACFELHTYSSLNKEFLQQYRNTFQGADQAVVFYTPKTLEIKNLPPLSKEEIENKFDFQGMRVFTNHLQLEAFLRESLQYPAVLLFMSSGQFGGLDMNVFTQ